MNGRHWPTVPATLFVLLSLCLPLAQGAIKDVKYKERVHTVFSAECNDYMDWQTLALVYSHRRSGQPGGITRLLSCSTEDLIKYKGLHLAPTHVCPSWKVHPDTADWYPPYNKPLAIDHWFRYAKPKAEYIIVLDTDMLFMEPLIPWELGARRGRPIASNYNYLIGCDNPMAAMYTKNPHLCQKVGGTLVMHNEDLKKVAPLWLSLTEELRQDPRGWKYAHDSGDGTKPHWILEMYGYVFGAAELGLIHQIRNDLNLQLFVNTDTGGLRPKLLHYTLTLGAGNWTWDKAPYYAHQMLRNCRLFDPPPEPSVVTEPHEGMRMGALYMIECMNTLNAAMAEYYAATGCTPDGTWKEPDEAYKEHQRTRKKNKDEERVVPPMSTRLYKYALPRPPKLVCEGLDCGLLKSA